MQRCRIADKVRSGCCTGAGKMDLLLGAARGARSRVNGWLMRERLVLYSCTMCLLYVILLAAWASTFDRAGAVHVAKPGADFSVFWAASHVMLHGAPWQVYDHLAFARVEQTLFSGFPGGDFLPWLYPPTFLLIVTPLALLPFVLAYAVFIGVSVFAFVAGTLRVSGLAQSVGSTRVGALLLAACPCVFVAATFGQNSLLTAALVVLAVRWMERDPVRAGICIGLLIVKPQMALLFPLVLIAARAWRVLAVAAGSAALLAAVSVLVCGTQTLPLFMANASMARDLILEHGEHFWFASPATFAALRLDGVPVAPAYLAQGCVAAVAALAAWKVWSSTRDIGLRASILVVATLLANPYVWHYELAWLGIALACMTATGLRRGWLRGEQALLALAWLLPLYEYFNRWAKLPQIGPIVLLLVLLAILRRARTEAGAN